MKAKKQTPKYSQNVGTADQKYIKADMNKQQSPSFSNNGSPQNSPSRNSSLIIFARSHNNSSPKRNPYRSLNTQTERNDYLEFPTYSEDNGKIYESKQLMVYNQSFKDSVYEQIDSLPFNAIEKVMKSEGKDFSGGYKSSDSHSTSLFSIILMIICVFVLLFIYFFIIMDTRNKRIRA